MVAVPVPAMVTKTVCLVISHRWKRAASDDGTGVYRVCRRCGKVDDGYDPDPRINQAF